MNRFQKGDDEKQSIALSVISIENLKTLKYCKFLAKHYFFLLLVISVTIRMRKKLKKKNQLNY